VKSKCPETITAVKTIGEICVVKQRLAANSPWRIWGAGKTPVTSSLAIYVVLPKLVVLGKFDASLPCKDLHVFKVQIFSRPWRVLRAVVVVVVDVEELRTPSY
jgi:hypothetical protein